MYFLKCSMVLFHNGWVHDSMWYFENLCLLTTIFAIAWHPYPCLYYTQLSKFCFILLSSILQWHLCWCNRMPTWEEGWWSCPRLHHDIGCFGTLPWARDWWVKHYLSSSVACASLRNVESTKKKMKGALSFPKMNFWRNTQVNLCPTASTYLPSLVGKLAKVHIAYFVMGDTIL